MTPKALLVVLSCLPLAQALAIQDPEAARRGGRGRGAQGTGTASAPASAPESQGSRPAEEETPPPKPKEPRRGIPVKDPLVFTQCASCHEVDARGMMSRISYLRKSPEGWSESLKRMIRLFNLTLTPAEAKQIVRYLANQHGLTRGEAERSLYESERRVHWSEENHDQDFRNACAQCHTLGRVLAQQRDEEEWQLLRATHVAMFPLARGQMGGGPPPDEEAAAMARRFARPQRTRGGARQGTQAQPATQPPGEGSQSRPQGPDVGTRVLTRLAKDQPLFTPEWEQWTINRREVPLGGTWTVAGHEVGRGDVYGTAEVVRVDADEYDVTWRLRWSNGDTLERKGRGLLYAGYSWRGRSTDPGEKGATWREVLLLDDSWRRMRGRFFTGDYDEVGVDVELHRHLGLPRVLDVAQPAVTVPAQGHVVDVYGEALPEGLTAADFHLGAGVTVTRAERRSAQQVRLTLDVSPGSQVGPRVVSFGADRGVATIVLYDGIDYVRITPVQGFARIGGGTHPKQIERFEAVAVNRGPDGKPYTADDLDVMTVAARWELKEFPVREDDDDVRYVGTLDPNSALFTPSGEGPNPQRKWQANNVGDVLVEATTEILVPIRPPDKKPEAESQPGTQPGSQQGSQRGTQPGTQPDTKATRPATLPVPEPPPPQGALPVMERRTFRARGHLLVTVPQYVRWTRLEWEDR